MNIARLLIVLYAALCVVALWFIPASAYGWLGVEPDPLAGVFAILLALPWTLLLRLMPNPEPWPSAALLAAGMAMNVWLLWRLQSWWQRSRARRQQ